MISNYLYWTEIKLYSIFYKDHWPWWDFYYLGHSQYNIKNNFPPKVFNKITYSWYPFPVLAETSSTVKLGIPINLNWQGRHIDHFTNYAEPHGFNWHRKTSDYFKPLVHPRPCSQCSWYCQQQCKL